MQFAPSTKSQEYVERVRDFIATHIAPVEAAHWRELRAQHHGGDWTMWRIPPLVEELKSKAKAAGLWNLFLPDEKLGVGLSTLEYAPVAEEMGRRFLAPEVFNCSAPDTGNIEVLLTGTAAQQERWAAPLLAGECRSVFCMTEPEVASSDATNMQATAIVEGDTIRVRGRKHWVSGLGDPRAKFALVMAKTPNPQADRHHQHSLVIVPLDAHGVTIRRMQSVFGDYDAPHGHGEVEFDDVIVDVANMVRGPGDGFKIGQSRLGPGRIHHCMRCIGAAEVALELMIKRGASRSAFGKPLIQLGGNRERIAEARIAIDQARLLTLFAAWKLDDVGALAALTEISAIKVVAPRMLQKIVDDAIQMHGGIGISDDTPLAQFFAQARALRLADGPDEVHLGMIARLELGKHGITR